LLVDDGSDYLDPGSYGQWHIGKLQDASTMLKNIHLTDDKKETSSRSRK